MAQVRGSRPSAARERLLETADRLFYNEGIHAVGVNRIVDEAGVTRVTLYRHFPSKDDLIAAYLERRAQSDRDQVGAIIARNSGDPRRALDELATALTSTDFAAVKRGCPFINASAEFASGHGARAQAGDIREWISARVEQLLVQAGHRRPRATAQQLMMLRTGAVMSAALDRNSSLNQDFLDCWSALIDDGLLPNVAGSSS
jgi:AcrR family transcriptional regulator